MSDSLHHPLSMQSDTGSGSDDENEDEFNSTSAHLAKDQHRDSTYTNKNRFRRMEIPFIRSKRTVSILLESVRFIGIGVTILVLSGWILGLNTNSPFNTNIRPSQEYTGVTLTNKPQILQQFNNHDNITVYDETKEKNESSSISLSPPPPPPPSSIEGESSLSRFDEYSLGSLVPTGTVSHNFVFDESLRFDFIRFLSGHHSLVARWEDPIQFKKIKQQEKKWTALDDTLYDLTREPVVYDTAEKKSRLPFNPARFRELNIPILWTDSTAPKDPHNFAHVHWNAAAEKKAVELIRQQQFPQPPVDCTKAKYVIIEQWGSGFFSRYNTGMEQLSRALNVGDRQLIIAYTPMNDDKSALIQRNANDDYLNEGMTQYFQPFAQCQFHPFVQAKIRLSGKPGGIGELTGLGVPVIYDWNWVQPGGKYFETQFVHMCNEVCWSHPTDASTMLPRRLLFDHRVYSEHDLEWRQSQLTQERADFSVEHIYPIDEVGLVPSDQQWNDSVDHRSRMLKEFMEIVLSAFFFRPTGRILLQRSLLSDYWRTQMVRRKEIYPTSELLAPGEADELDNSAGIFVRRGDKCNDDYYCVQHNRQFRGLGLFVHSVYLEEQRRGKPFSSIFFMSDDGKALDDLFHQVSEENQGKPFEMSSKAEIDAAVASNDDMRIARTILRGRWLTSNIFAPASCFNPSVKEGFESFLTNLQYLLHHNAFVVGHESSNVMYWLARMLFFKNQFHPSVTRTGPGAWSQDVRDSFN